LIFYRIVKRLVPERILILYFDLRCQSRKLWLSLICPERPISKGGAVIVAPHPDDETFGCGALIAKKRQAGDAIRIVFLTKGEAVNGGQMDPVIVARERKLQALIACHCLGVAPGETRWLDLIDGSVPRPGQARFDEAVELLRKEIETTECCELYCPHQGDLHPDHEAAYLISQTAVSRSGKNIKLIQYPIWIYYLASTGKFTYRFNHAWKHDSVLACDEKSRAVAAYLNGKKGIDGKPYCGELPDGLVKAVTSRYEIFFSQDARGARHQKFPIASME
jgi:LmbE family N-acetylglucosaminyl deacetylase